MEYILKMILTSFWNPDYIHYACVLHPLCFFYKKRNYIYDNVRSWLTLKLEEYTRYGLISKKFVIWVVVQLLVLEMKINLSKCSLVKASKFAVADFLRKRVNFEFGQRCWKNQMFKVFCVSYRNIYSSSYPSCCQARRLLGGNGHSITQLWNIHQIFVTPAEVCEQTKT